MAATANFNLWSIQPFKVIYVCVSLLELVIVRIPFWALKNLRRSWRPRTSWTLRRCIQVNLLRFNLLRLNLLQLNTTVGGRSKNPDHRALVLGKGVQGLYIDGVSPELILGDVKHWATIAQVEPLRIPGYWQTRPGAGVIQGERPLPNEKVLYYMHGGGYTILSAHPLSPFSCIPRKLLQHSPSSGSLVLRRAFAIEYRLTEGGEHPFPAQLLDALAGYKYLLDAVGFEPHNVIFVGDSAGANLALALMRYLLECGPSVSSPPLDGAAGSALPPPPGALVLLSPWVDLSGSHDTPGSLAYTNMASDFLITPPPAPGEQRSIYGSALDLVRPFDRNILGNRYISPSSLDLRHPQDVNFVGFPPTFISAGGAEVLVDQIETLHQRMVKDMGEGLVRSFVTKDAIHDFLALEFAEPERTELAIEIGKWLKSLYLGELH